LYTQNLLTSGKILSEWGGGKKRIFAPRKTKSPWGQVIRRTQGRTTILIRVTMVTGGTRKTTKKRGGKKEGPSVRPQSRGQDTTEGERRLEREKKRTRITETGGRGERTKKEEGL